MAYNNGCHHFPKCDQCPEDGLCPTQNKYGQFREEDINQAFRRNTMAENPLHARVRAETEMCVSLGEMARGITGDLQYEPSDAIKGKFIKHYSYDRFDEVYVETFENGAVLFKAGGHYEWFGKARVKACFEKAKTLGARSKALNRMMG